MSRQSVSNLGLHQPDAVAESSQCLGDALASVAAVHAEVLQSFLVWCDRLLLSLRWRLAESVLQQLCCDDCLVLLQRTEQSQHVRSGSDHGDFEVGHHDGWVGSISQLDTDIFDGAQQFLILRLGLPAISLGLAVFDQRTLTSSKKLSVEQSIRLLFCCHSRAERTCRWDIKDMNVGIFGCCRASETAQVWRRQSCDLLWF